MGPIHLTLTIQATGQCFSPSELIITLGSQSGNTIALPNDQAISRRHATITWQNGQYVLQDNKSSNGTFVNEQRLTQPHILKHNDVISIGQTKLTVGLEEAEVGTVIVGRSENSLVGSNKQTTETLTVPSNSSPPKESKSVFQQVMGWMRGK